MNQDAREAFLDGYRHGLGSAVRATEHLTNNLTNHRIPEDHQTSVRSVLVGLASGLRLISASAILAEHQPPADD